MIYLDNAATSFPKPESVYEAVNRALRSESGNPGRSGHRLSLSAGRLVEDARLLLSQLFHVSAPERIVFTANATDALNTALFGTLSPGDHVVTGSMEHNSVVRPLEALRQAGVAVTRVPVSPAAGAALADIEAAVRSSTKLVVLSHASNVTGTVNPIAEIGAFCRERGILFLVDAAQSAGVFPIDVGAMNIDLLAFPGHKGLLGPQGTGGLYIRPGVETRPLRFGGTGSHSELLTQPAEYPDRYESGTLNVPGLAGLAAGVRFILGETVEAVRDRESSLTHRLIGGLSELKGVTLYGPPAGEARSGVVSIRLDGMEPAETALILDSAFDIAVRAGLHCAPDTHRTLGTLGDGGTVRLSVGFFNTPDEIDTCVNAVREITRTSMGRL